MSSGSITDTDESSLQLGETSSENVLLEEPLFYILAKYFETPNGDNVATILSNMVDEIKKLRSDINQLKNITSTPTPISASTSSLDISSDKKVQTD